MPNKTLTIGSVSNPVDIGVTGTLTAPTPTSGSGNTQVATKGYVDTAISNAESPPEVFTVTLTLNVEYAPPRYIGDKTYSEIQAAITAGKLVQVRSGDLTYYYVGKDIIDNTLLLFISSLYVTPYTNIKAPSLELFTLSSSNLWTSMGAIGQARITASGILKGDGSGNVAVATAGTDYAAASHNHAASNITSGTLDWARLPGSRIYDATASRTANTVLAAPNGSAGAASFRALVTADIPNLDAGKITSGTFTDARIPNLGAGKITSGTFAIARIPTSNSQSNSTATVPTSALVYGMNTRLTSIETNGAWSNLTTNIQKYQTNFVVSVSTNESKINANSGLVKIKITLVLPGSKTIRNVGSMVTGFPIPKDPTTTRATSGTCNGVAMSPTHTIFTNWLVSSNGGLDANGTLNTSTQDTYVLEFIYLKA